MFTLKALHRALPDARVMRSPTSSRVWTPHVDSRGLLPHDALFVALRGERFDGHQFLEEVCARGVKAVIVAHEEVALTLDFELVIVVPDTTRALQQLAAYWRTQMPAKRVAITGSLGKTIVKEMLSAILSQRFTTYRSPGSYNSQIGVPLALLGIRPIHHIAIIEAGISRPGEMKHHLATIAPDFGILTSLSVAHPAELPNEDITLREKLVLFEQLGKDALILPDEVAHAHPERTLHVYPQLDDAHYGAALGWTFTLWLDVAQRSAPLTLQAPGEHMLRNAVTAVRAALALGCTIDDVAAGLRSYTASPMRLEVHTTPDGITLLNDAYSADPVSARAALDALVQHGGQARKIAIFGEMRELGELSELAHRELGELVATSGIERLVTLGSAARWIASSAIAHGLPKKATLHCEDLDELDGHVRGGLFLPGDVILFKASRAVGLERVAQRYLESLGPTRLTVDLGAIRDNFHALRQSLGVHTGIMAVVKSFGYGNDATRVSRTLIREGVCALSVAYADEAIPLRKTGITLPILIHNTLTEDLEKIVKYGLTAIIYSHQVARELARISALHDAITPVHIKIDTGMHRVGLQLEEVSAFADLLKKLPTLRVTGVMTHLAAADDANHDAFTLTQLDRFDAAIHTLRDMGIPAGQLHAANTSAAWRFPRARHDLVRVGLGLYGLDPSDDVSEAHAPLREALRLTTRVIHVHEVDQAESVGYGRGYIAPQNTIIATIAIGYGDGFARAMSHGGVVLIQGTRCEVVGKVCMDVCMVDVTHLGARVKPGDEVVIFGEQGGVSLHINEMAQRCHTISYEILCNISPRVRRIFVQS